MINTIGKVRYTLPVQIEYSRINNSWYFVCCKCSMSIDITNDMQNIDLKQLASEHIHFVLKPSSLLDNQELD